MLERSRSTNRHKRMEFYGMIFLHSFYNETKDETKDPKETKKVEHEIQKEH